MSSIFLDTIRFFAALTVFIVHTRAFIYPKQAAETLPNNISHGAVILFFVLSGYVIAHTTQNNKRNFKEYCVARYSRLYSIYLPAIVISLICYFVIRYTDANMFEKFQQESITKALIRFVASVLFLNEIWFQSTAPIINGPIWSLNYEFWFYIVFGFWFYRKRGIKGLILPLLVSIIAGPKILLMMFMWMIGWLAYGIPKLILHVNLSWLLVFVSLLIAIFLIIYLPDIPNGVNTTKLRWADKFATDFIVSLFIGLTFYLLPNGSTERTDNKIIRFFRKIGDLTFPIYVLHFPLLALSNSLFPKTFALSVQLTFTLASIFSVCAITGLILELFRPMWGRLFRNVFR